MGRVRAAARAGWVPSLIVALGLIALQLLLIPMDREPGWDEAIYLSQANPDVPDLPFVASRARGIVVLVWPLVRLGLSLEAIRVILAVASSAALVAAAAAWRRMLTPVGSAVAAAAIGTSWLFLSSGSEVMPNLWSAVLLLGAGGSVAAGLADEHARPGPGALALVALAAFVRPPDALLFLVGLLIALVWLRARPAWLAAVAIAVAVGVLPWLLELAARAGSFAGALDEARRLGHVTAAGGLGDRVLQHLALTDGPALGPDPGAIPWGGVVWWLALLVLAARSPFRRERAASVGGRVAVSTGSVLLGGYVLLVAGLAPRFLLPAIALLVVAAVLGAAPLPAALRAALVVGLVAWGVWQAGVAADVARRARDDRASAAAAGEAVARAAEGGPCQVLATDAYPQIGYASGCEATWLHESAITVSGSLLTFVVVPSDEPVPSGLGGGPVAAPAGWTIVRLER